MFTSDENLRVVQMVARYQSISAAAERLNKVPSAVSYTVRKLEETLGVQLFTRKGCYIQLTTAGEYFISHSKAILDDLEALKRNVALVGNGVQPEFTIAVNNIVPHEAIVQFVCDFEQAFGSCQLTIRQEVYNGCWDALYANRADLVIGAPHSIPQAEGVVGVPLGNLAWVFVVGAGHPLAGADRPLLNSELRRYSAVCIRDTAVEFQSMQAWLLEGQKAIFVPDLATATALIRRNAAIGYLPEHVARSLDTTDIAIRAVREAKPSTRLFLAYRSTGLGDVGRWCVDYLTRARFKNWLCGEPGEPGGLPAGRINARPLVAPHAPAD
jgi:DNA-binding transcriptional LysR family regulator